ncbi:MAG: hypothetical protein DRI75_11800, partial [Bacteroidetes bacterium]
MTIKDSALASGANYIYNLKSGDLYFYDDYIISEVHEGVIVMYKDSLEVLNLVHKHYGFKKHYGLISHRFNSYSVNLSDLLPIAHESGLLVANAVVAYTDMALKNFELEKRVLMLKGESF